MVVELSAFNRQHKGNAGHAPSLGNPHQTDGKLLANLMQNDSV
jgi:hypothetical protein